MATKAERPQNKASKILEEYKAQHRKYEVFAARISELLETVFQRENIRLHSINHRAKDPDSLEGKVTRPDKSYQKLEDITDLAGIRIITHFSDQVDQIARVIEREFNTDATRSVDKRAERSLDSFGYTSVHKICSLKPPRTELREYDQFKGLFCEIQIRSILQHAWAEIEHDLGYKSVAAPPKSLTRRFSQLAALLELADDEFTRVRNELHSYSSDVKADIASQPQRIGIDNVTLQIFIDSDPLLREVELESVRAISKPLKQVPSDDRSAVANIWAHRLRQAGIENIEELRTFLSERRQQVAMFCEIYGSTARHYHSGFSLHFLSLLKVGQIADPEAMLQKLNDMGFSKEESHRYRDELVDFYGHYATR
ncbi:RelA/SpoT domain-containing protein [Pyxidicoccus parkwayensis]|uniref:RelA/SpoT domain-containing protein n=1 Tax=Pyxidicoccus parkwayensis TaxID=2813578 RepID=A0ABX7P6N8_9BACT|nr:RelA/SpoT domain-containing protein [Pyxidicoccus parkwaysis]QSQ26155.1 RelA/SpoT domain-containing protein [Pyxidicoccus parkwaysis]